MHGILHFDAKGWKTIPLLVAFPGLLTRRYIDGQRKNYVTPLALFLFMAFLTFFATSSGEGQLLTRDANIASLTNHAASAKLRVERNELAVDEARKADVGVAGVEKAPAISRKLHHEAEQRLLHVVSPEKATNTEGVELREPGWVIQFLEELEETRQLC